MFRDDTLISYEKTDNHVKIFPSSLKRNITRQAASMLVQHITFRKQFSYLTQNSNGNALDAHDLSFNHHRRNNKEFKRTDKCHSWLTKYPTTSDTSLHRAPILIRTPFYSNNLSRFHSKQTPLSSNANNEINPPFESFPQPLIIVDKKRLPCDYFLSNMHNCIQPPYSPNHFYAFDQINLLKLQRSFQFNSKRKYSEDVEGIASDRTYSSKKQQQPSTGTVDQRSLKKKSPSLINTPVSEPPESDSSHQILSRLEKILNLCGELRSLAKDVESHLNEQSTSQTIPVESDEKHSLRKSQSEQTMVDIYKELETPQALTEIPSPEAYQQTNDISSVHSHPLMQTESFKTKSPDSTASHTTLRTPEDICSCFVKSLVEKQNCQLSSEEQDYLNELTKAYVLGREQTLREQHETKEFLNETVPDELEEIDHSSSLVFDTKNNNQSMTPISPSPVIVYDHFQKSDEHSLSKLIPPKKSTISFTSNAQPQSANPDESVSIKHQLFLDECIGTKKTNVLPGIGLKYAQQLTDCGFSTVRRLLGFYLMIKDDRKFVVWLNMKVGISVHSAWLCTNALRAWCHSYL